MVRIITDSAADFEHSESEKFGISTVPLAVYIDGKEYKDDFLHSKERFYRLAKLSKTLLSARFFEHHLKLTHSIY